jgi:hypothetical protein
MMVKYDILEILLIGLVVSHDLINDEQLVDNDDIKLQDDHNSRSLIMYDERETSITLSVPSRSQQKQPGDHIDAQRKVRKLLQLYLVNELRNMVFA